MTKLAKRVIARSPSHLEPPRVAILPTATAGSKQSVVTAKAQKSTLKGKKFLTVKIRGMQPEGQNSGHHRQTPPRHPQLGGNNQRQPYDSKHQEVRRDAPQVRGDAPPRPPRQAEREQQNTRNEESAKPTQAGVQFRQAHHQSKRTHYAQHKSGQPPPATRWELMVQVYRLQHTRP